MDNETTLRQLVDLLQNRGPHREGVETVHGCKYIASILRDLIWAIHGEARARSIFLELGWPIGANEASAKRIFQWLRRLSRSKQQYIADGNLLFDLEMMSQSAGQLAHKIAAKENIEFETADKRIKRAKKRYRRMGGGDISKT